MGNCIRKKKFMISIHVLREEDDIWTMPTARHYLKISIHVLREEDDSKNREKSLCFCPII